MSVQTFLFAWCMHVNTDISKLVSSAGSRSLWYAADQQVTWWTPGWVGKGVRLALPTCCVKVIKHTFSDSFGHYIDFRLQPEKVSTIQWKSTYEF